MIQVNFSFFKKDGAKFKALFKSRPMNWCKFMDGSNTKITAFQKAVISAVSTQLKAIIKPCPYTVKTYEVNITSIDRKFLLLLPEGVYRVELLVSSKLDSMIALVSVLIELKI
jgi:hypothetical protein